MIIYHQRNVGGFKGAVTSYWPLQTRIILRVSKTTAAAGVTIIAQARSTHRFVFGRIFSRVN